MIYSARLRILFIRPTHVGGIYHIVTDFHLVAEAVQHTSIKRNCHFFIIRILFRILGFKSIAAVGNKAKITHFIPANCNFFLLEEQIFVLGMYTL